MKVLYFTSDSFLHDRTRFYMFWWYHKCDISAESYRGLKNKNVSWKHWWITDKAGASKLMGNDDKPCMQNEPFSLSSSSVICLTLLCAGLALRALGSWAGDEDVAGDKAGDKDASLCASLQHPELSVTSVPAPGEGIRTHILLFPRWEGAGGSQAEAALPAGNLPLALGKAVGAAGALWVRSVCREGSPLGQGHLPVLLLLTHVQLGSLKGSAESNISHFVHNISHDRTSASFRKTKAKNKGKFQSAWKKNCAAQTYGLMRVWVACILRTKYR